VRTKFEVRSFRAGFSWWGAWGPAIGVEDGGQGGCLPHYTLKNPGKYFFSGQNNVKFGLFPEKCVKFGHFVIFFHT